LGCRKRPVFPALEASVERKIYAELEIQVTRLTELQRELNELRAKIRDI
jgi:hypothetical protein